MQFIQSLSESDIKLLQEIYETSESMTSRRRAHAVLLSSKQFSVTQIAEILEVPQGTVSSWLEKWQAVKFESVYDNGQVNSSVTSPKTSTWNPPSKGSSSNRHQDSQFPIIPTLEHSSYRSNSAQDGRSLCTSCGICCSGKLFSYVDISKEEANQLANLGMDVYGEKSKNFKQPCTSFGSSGCSIYSSRPAVCRKYQCRLLKDVIKGARALDEAMQTVEITKVQADILLRMLAEEYSENFGEIWIIERKSLRNELSSFAKLMDKKLREKSALTEEQVAICYNAFDYVKGVSQNFTTPSLLNTYANLILAIEDQAEE
mgnify:CR=1 FL=1